VHWLTPLFVGVRVMLMRRVMVIWCTELLNFFFCFPKIAVSYLLASGKILTLSCFQGQFLVPFFWVCGYFESFFSHRSTDCFLIGQLYFMEYLTTFIWENINNNQHLYWAHIVMADPCQKFLNRVGSGHVSHFWFGFEFGKFPPKNVKFFNFFPFGLGQKVPWSASYLQRVKSKLGSGQSPSLSAYYNKTIPLKF